MRTHLHGVRGSALAVALVVLLSAGAGSAPAPATQPAAAAEPAPTRVSQYVDGADGTPLAVDIWLPSNVAARRDLPVVIEFTRYWRSRQAPGGAPSATVRHFVNAGYAFVVADARGTGASFGSRSTEFSPAEVRDMGAIIAWAATQSWSNGRVATLGTSYAGNTAELAAISGRSELRAVVPRFSDFSAYRHAVRPGGVRNRVIADAWIALTRALDANRLCDIDASAACEGAGAPTVPGVDDDPSGARRAASIVAHQANTDLTGYVDGLVFADDAFGADAVQTYTLDGVSPSKLWRQIDAANVPSFHWASWFDGGTAEGVLTRFTNYRSPMRVIIGPWTHGGGYQAVTDGASAKPETARPSPQQQVTMIQQFLDPIMKSEPPQTPPGLGEVHYYTLGREEWRTTPIWPPAHVRETSLYFQDQGGLAETPPKGVGSDSFIGDPKASTGTHNRWHTQLGAPVVYSDRRAEKALTYTTPPLSRAAEITGSPSVQIELASTHSAGALFVYLEQVFPDGRVAYLTEGEIDLKFHGDAPAPKDFIPLGPTHRFEHADARKVTPGEPIRLSFSLHPISVEVQAGNRLRVALTTADADTFETSPSAGAATLTIFRQEGRASSIRLPMAYN